MTKVEFLPKEVDSSGMYVGFSNKSKCNAMKTALAHNLRKEVEAGHFTSILDAVRKKIEK